MLLLLNFSCIFVIHIILIKKEMKQKLFTIFSISMLSAGLGLNAATFTSNIASGSYNSAASWVVVGFDSDGIPDSDDDLTILLGHNIINNTTSACRDLTVDGTITVNSPAVFSIWGNYVVNGTEAGSNGAIVFPGIAGLSISGGGTFSSPSTGVRYTFASGSSRTISAGTTIVKLANVSIANATVTNLGNFTLTTVPTSAGATWINGANSSLTIRSSGFMSGRTFTASSSGNSVILTYPTGNIPVTTSGYYNLSIAGVSGTKSLPSNTTVGNNLTINANNALNSNNFDLTVGGNWSNAGSFTASAGKTVTFNGTSAQTVSNTLGTTTFTGLTINNTSGVSLASGTYILNEVLTISNGTFSTGGRPFTMTSTAGQTARIAPITGTGAISGSFIIQRFITSRIATWADMSSPVQASTFADWDAELPARYYVYSPPSSYPTQYSYSEGADDFVAVTSNSTILTPGKGYEVFLTGDYSYGNLPNTTLTTIGVPNQLDQNLNSLVSFSNAGSNLVGNPFASSISWSSVLSASSGLSSSYDVFDYTAGNYSTFGAGTEIGSGQGFWVYATGAPTLIINESAKTTSSNSSLRNMNVIQPYLSLQLTNINNQYSHSLKFATNKTAVDGFDINEDHPYRKSPIKSAPSITCKLDGKKSVINTFNSNNDNYSVPLEVYSLINGSFTIDAKGFEFVDEYSCITLEDKKLNNFINLKEQPSYSFLYDINDSENRFVLHFSKDGNCKSVVNSPIANTFENQVQILQNTNGNIINFNFDGTFNTVISVTNILGQNIIENASVQANNQSINVTLPENFTGIYIIKVENEKGAVAKKFIK